MRQFWLHVDHTHTVTIYYPGGYYHFLQAKSAEWMYSILKITFMICALLNFPNNLIILVIVVP